MSSRTIRTRTHRLRLRHAGFEQIAQKTEKSHLASPPPAITLRDCATFFERKMQKWSDAAAFLPCVLVNYDMCVKLVDWHMGCSCFSISGRDTLARDADEKCCSLTKVHSRATRKSFVLMRADFFEGTATLLNRSRLPGFYRRLRIGEDLFKRVHRKLFYIVGGIRIPVPEGRHEPLKLKHFPKRVYPLSGSFGTLASFQRKQKVLYLCGGTQARTQDSL